MSSQRTSSSCRLTVYFVFCCALWAAVDAFSASYSTVPYAATTTTTSTTTRSEVSFRHHPHQHHPCNKNYRGNFALYQSTATTTATTAAANKNSNSNKSQRWITVNDKPTSRRGFVSQQDVINLLPNSSRSSSSTINLKQWFLLPLEQTAMSVTDTAKSLWQQHQETATAGTAAVISCLQHYYWLLPLVWLAVLVPLYHVLVLQTLPVTPDYWKLVNMDFVHHNYDRAWAMGIVTAFLTSNISYLLAGGLLLWRSNAATTTTTTTTDNNNYSYNKYSNPKRQQVNNTATTATARTKSLGLWVLAAGLMSTTFHAVQAMGGDTYFRIAEALCYLDHGVAGTAILYFWKHCGCPSKRTWMVSVLGLLTLAFPCTAVCPALYTWFHSAWHFLSAGAAVVWVNDSSSSSDTTTEIAAFPPPQ